MEKPAVMTNRHCSRKLRSLFVIIFLSSLLPHANSVSAQTYEVVHAFAGTPDGSNSFGGVTLDDSGNLYGITASGGRRGRGIIYEIDPDGNETILYDLIKRNGGFSFTGLLRDAAGNLYGTTSLYAEHDKGGIFRYYHSGRFGVLYAFGSQQGFDGAVPESNLVRGADGQLYGTTIYGGSFDAGILFKVDRKTGAYSIVHTFAGPDGSSPNGNLVFDALGNLYGTSEGGGAFSSGTVYKVDPSGSETVVYSFAVQGSGDGEYPTGGLYMDEFGVLYGTTASGGTHGLGTVFKLTTDGQEDILYNFGDSTPDGVQPTGGVVQDRFGNFYGTTYLGGEFGHGSAFKLDVSGGLTLLHSFTLGTDGGAPLVGLTGDSEGNLYGTASKGGSPDCNCGVVFKITP